VFPATVLKDRFIEGVALLVIGAALLIAALAVAMADPSGLFRWVAGALAFVGATSLWGGARWVRRRVELSQAGISIAGAGATLTIPLAAIASVLVRLELQATAPSGSSGQILNIKAVDGRKARLAVRGAAQAALVQRWVDLVCDHLLARWNAALAAGETVSVSKHVQLVGSTLLRKGVRTHLDQPFDLQEVPATRYDHALLTVTAQDQRFILESDEENHPVLRRLLLTRHSQAAPRR
jgi:hypothetical protein